MIWHFHDFGRWEDVKLGEKLKGGAPGLPIFVVRQVIEQQRRCVICNRVQTKHSA